MADTYFKVIGQKSVGGKVVIMAVVDEDFFGVDDLPNIFEIQAIKQQPTIYTGTYPSIKFNMGALKDKNDLLGMGIAGILTSEKWYCEKRESRDVFGINLL